MKDYLIKSKIIYKAALVLYLMLILWEMFMGPYRTHSKEMAYNLYPFMTIVDFVVNFSAIGLKMFIINLVGNIVFFIPFGILLPLIFGKTFQSGRNIVLFSIFAVFTLETMQMLLKVGVFDIDDIILNTFGIVCGYFILNKRKELLSGAELFVSCGIKQAILKIGKFK